MIATRSYARQSVDDRHVATLARAWTNRENQLAKINDVSNMELFYSLVILRLHRLTTVATKRIVATLARAWTTTLRYNGR